MAVRNTNENKINAILQQEPGVSIFLRPIAPPEALGLAAFAGSAFITASWMANWWGNADSPKYFFPFVATFGGLAQFIAGLKGFPARDTLVSVIHTMWGAFWIAMGIMYLLVATGTLVPHSIKSHFPELASWFVVLTLFTWSGTIAAFARDLILFACYFSLAMGSTLSCALFIFSEHRLSSIIKVAAYFFLVSALLAWWRVTVYLMEEAYGTKESTNRLFPVFRTTREKGAPLIVPGLGEPGVKRGMPGVL